MNSTDASQPATGLGPVVVNGIQDVSAFLPLLGTDQCERHVSQGLERGFWYVAGTPLSIFGSLGIIKAGLATLVISIDSDFRFCRGPRLLHNAGFSPTGILKQLTYAFDTDDSIYVAEQKIRSLLHLHRTVEVVPNLYSWPWMWWNLQMLGSTMLLSGVGILPYTYIITRDLAHRPFFSTWMYPILRVGGSALAAAMIQLIIQFRILIIVHRRLTFHAVNHLFKRENRAPPTFWNPAMRSEVCLSKLKDHVAQFHWNPEKHEFVYLRDRANKIRLDPRFSGIGTFTSFHHNETQTGNKITFEPEIPLFIFRLLLACGIAATGVGYIGCFNIVQSSLNEVGPLLWLGLEVSLSVARLAIWAANPSWDDPPKPIVLSAGDGNNVVTYDIGWMLEDVTVKDLYAAVIDIGPVHEFTDPLAIAIPHYAMFEYLTEDLGVPPDQVQHLLQSDAAPIVEALRSLAKNSSIRRSSPIIIYISYHGDDATNSEWIGNNPDGLLYSKFFELVHQISETKGENVTVILDTNFPSLGTNIHVGVEQQAHVLLTACSQGQTAQEVDQGGNCGLFTQTLLAQLRGDGNSKVEELTYQKAIDNVTRLRVLSGEDPERPRQTPRCTGTFKNRLIFNGILARKRVREARELYTSLISTVLEKTEVRSAV